MKSEINVECPNHEHRFGSFWYHVETTPTNGVSWRDIFSDFYKSESFTCARVRLLFHCKRKALCPTTDPGEHCQLNFPMGLIDGLTESVF